MKIRVKRIIASKESTLSEVYVDGVRVCFGLEDEARVNKIKGETRIPAGSYKINVRAVGGKHEEYKKKFGWHKGMLWLQDVPNYEYVLIHIGNRDTDTMGCLLVGSGTTLDAQNVTLSNSTIAYEQLYKKVLDAAIVGNLWIEYVDNDK